MSLPALVDLPRLAHLPVTRHDGKDDGHDDDENAHDDHGDDQDGHDEGRMAPPVAGKTPNLLPDNPLHTLPRRRKDEKKK